MDEILLTWEEQYEAMTTRSMDVNECDAICRAQVRKAVQGASVLAQQLRRARIERDDGLTEAGNEYLDGIDALLKALCKAAAEEVRG